MAPPKLNVEEIKLRGSILSNDRELLQLHKTLVRGGLITEEEFWETRQSLLRNQESLVRQRKPPISTNLLGKPASGNAVTGGNEQKIILTPETIQSILEQNLRLRTAHTDLVPTEMTEKEFWTFYVRSRFFRHTASDVDSEKNPLNEYYIEEEKEDAKDDMALYLDPTAQSSVSRLVDLVATREDHQGETLSERTRQLIRQQSGQADNLSLIRKFNLHSLKTVTIATGPSRREAARLPISIEEAVELEDLKRAEEEALPRLINLEARKNNTLPPEDKNKNLEQPSIEDISAFIDGVKKHPLEGRSVAEHLERLCLTNQEFTENLNQHFVLDDDTFPEKDQLAHEETPSDAKTFHGHALEVLQHFWYAHPPGRDPEKRARYTRLYTILQQFAAKGNDLISSNEKLSILLSPIIKSIHRTLETYEAYK